jgi:hypothetical protein
MNLRPEKRIRHNFVSLATRNQSINFGMTLMLDRAFQADVRAKRSDSIEIRRTVEKFLTAELLFGGTPIDYWESSASLP